MPEPPYYLWDHWYLAGRSSEVKASRAHGVTIMETRLVLYRQASGEVVALRDRCPHLGASLALGRVKGDCLACPFHGWTFDSRGTCVDIPALGDPTPRLRGLTIPRYHVREAAGLIWVFMTRRPDLVPTSDPVPPELLDPTWAWGLVEDVWPTNYTRFVENMLDMGHLPYVHARTIGRLSRPRGPLEPTITEQPGGFDIAGGQLEFRLPNVHRLRISEAMGMYMWGVPTGPEETKIYILGLRRFARARLLKPLFNWMNRRILNEDRRIIESQEPKHVTFGPGGDLLMRPDSAAKAYRKLLARALDASPFGNDPTLPVTEGRESDRSES
ncbi:MAG TPA: aromatic ring-hydroxylating dioxygenase subunit alpha [Stenomitos sp.]